MNNQRRGVIPPYLQQHKSGKYQPEYKKLDLEPVQPGLEDTPNTPSNYIKAGVKRPLSQKHNVPSGRSLPAQVGNNEEQLWMDDSVVGSTSVKIKANQYIDNNEFVDVDAIQGRKKAAQYPEEDPSYQQDSNTQEQEKNIVSALNKAISPSEYIVYYGEIIVKTYDPLEVKKAIEHLVLNDVPVEDIFVCKRLNINFGAILDDAS